MAVPSLGYGKPTEATIDQVNQWMRSSPWYQDLLKSWGQDPNNTHLNESQRQQVIKGAQAQGVVVDQGDMEVDPAGNFNPKGHKLRNTLIVAGIAGATIATMGMAGAFSGAAIGPSTAANMAATSAIAGGSAVPASLAGLTAAELAAVGGGAAALAPLAATTTAAGSAALPTGLASGSSAAAGGSTAGLGGTTATGVGSKLAGYGKNLLSEKGTEAAGKALAGSAQAMASNRGTAAELALDQNRDLESQLIAREQEKRTAQSDAYKKAQMGNRAATWQPLARPANVPGSYQGMTPEGQAAGSELFKQAMARMTSPDLQNPTGMPTYRNMATDPAFQSSLKPGVAERVAGAGSWALPLVSAILNRK